MIGRDLVVTILGVVFVIVMVPSWGLILYVCYLIITDDDRWSVIDDPIYGYRAFCMREGLGSSTGERRCQNERFT